jgi:ribosome-associated protein
MAAEEEPTIRLDQFLKWRGLADSGGQAKVRVQAGEVTVNGAVETRRGKKLRSGDRVGIDGEEHAVELPPARERER